MRFLALAKMAENLYIWYARKIYINNPNPVRWYDKTKVEWYTCTEQVYVHTGYKPNFLIIS